MIYITRKLKWLHVLDFHSSASTWDKKSPRRSPVAVWEGRGGTELKKSGPMILLGVTLFRLSRNMLVWLKAEIVGNEVRRKEGGLGISWPQLPVLAGSVSAELLL
jgi:hypothetical protein